MIVVVGHLVVDPAHREEHLTLSLESVRGARAAPGCVHFSVTADPVEEDRVDVAEVWTSRAALDAYRASGSADEPDGPDAFANVREFHVQEHEVVTGK